MKRKSDKPEDTIAVALNFTPNPVEKYRLGLPAAGEYEELLNSDDTIFGGSGVINRKKLVTVNEEWYGRPCYIEIDLPPLGACVFKRQKTKNLKGYVHE